MRVTIVTGAFGPLPPDGIGAAEKIWSGLAPLIASECGPVTMISSASPSRPEIVGREGVFVTLVRGTRASRSLAIRLTRDLSYGMRVLPKLPKADILVSNDVTVSVLAPLIRREAGLLAVNLGRQVKSRAQWLQFRGASRIVVVSSAACERLASIFPGLAGRVEVIGNPVAVDELRGGERRTVHEGGSVWLYLGRIHPEKGLELLVRAFRTLHRERPQDHLRLVGPWAVEAGGGGADFLGRLRHLAAGLPVEFLSPARGTSGVAASLAEADFFCYPSLAENGETFGVAPLEACAAGLTPIVSALPCFRDFLKDGQTGYVFDHRAEDPERELARTLLKAAGQSAETRLRMSAMSVSTAERFRFERVAQEYGKMFEGMLREARGGLNRLQDV